MHRKVVSNSVQVAKKNTCKNAHPVMAVMVWTAQEKFQTDDSSRLKG